MKELPKLRNWPGHFPLKKGGGYHPDIDGAEKTIPVWNRLSPLVQSRKAEWTKLEAAIKIPAVLIIGDLMAIAEVPSILVDPLKKTPRRILRYLAAEPEFFSELLHLAMTARNNLTNTDRAMIAMRREPEKTNKEIAFETGIELSLVTKTRTALSRFDADYFSR